MSNRRVVLTGLGTVNPVAHNVPDFWSGLLNGVSGIRPIQRFDTEGYSSRIGGEVLDWAGVPSDVVNPREIRRMDRYAQFACAAAIEAVRDSGVDFGDEDVNRCGVIVGSGIGGLQELEEQHLRIRNKRHGDAQTPLHAP